MRTHRASKWLQVCICAFFSGVACSEGDTAPEVIEPIHDPSPATDAFSIPVHPVFAWEAPAVAVYFDVLLGLSRTELSSVAESLETPRYVPDQPLRTNQEYYWQVIAYNDSEEWESAIWRFVTINPNYLDPITPESVLINLDKAWQARDVTRYDSLLSVRYRYQTSVDQPDLPELDRASDLEATRKLFRSGSVLNTFGGVPTSLWSVQPSKHPGYPAAQDYWQADIVGVTFGIRWESENGQIQVYRLPLPEEAESLDAATGAIFYIEPAWPTGDGNTVYKLVEVLDFFRPPSAQGRGDGGHGDPGGGSPPDEMNFLVSWRRIKQIGAEIVE